MINIKQIPHHKCRNYSLDVIRIIACLMVILMHSPSPNPNPSSVVYGGISYLTSPCIGLFFMVSGANLLPSKLPLFSFLKKRIEKIIWPTLIWTIIYLLLKNILTEPSNSLLKELLSIPFSPQGHGVLWFMYTLIGIYLVTPIISPWLERAQNREIGFIVCLWIITLLYPFFTSKLIVRDDTTGTLYYFSGYIGYYIMGYYLQRIHFRINWLWLFCLYIVCILIFIIKKMRNWDFWDDGLFWYLGIFTAAMALTIYQFFCVNISSKINDVIERHNICRKIVISISTLSFGIYLIHIAIMRYILWNQAWFLSISNCVVETLICFLITFFVSYLIIYIISKFRFSKYIIGI